MVNNQIEVKGLTLERYNQLLKIERVHSENSLTIYTNTGYLGSGIKVVGKSELKELIRRYYKIINFRKCSELEGKISKLELELEHVNLINSSYQEQLANIRSKWWYKLFNKD